MPKGEKTVRLGKKTNEPITLVLPALLDERRMSLRALAREVGVNQSHLSRALAGSGEKVFSGELAGRIAQALDLPADYFPEFRLAAVRDALDRDAGFREAAYRQLRRRR